MSSSSARPLLIRAGFALAVWLVLGTPSLLPAENGVIDLAALPNYAKQPRPYYIAQDNTPIIPGAVPPPFAPNIMTDVGATLGRVLFYDKRLSRNNTVSCSSCHQQAHAFGDPATASTGVGGTTARHAMRLVNVRFHDFNFFWDRRLTILEQAVTQPIRHAIEMGFSGTNGDPSFDDLLAKLSALPEYQVLFNAAFGSPGLNELRIQKALAQFVRSIESFDTKYDAAVMAGGGFWGGFPSFTASEHRGLQLFVNREANGGANCSQCHFEPDFYNGSVGNNGVITALGGGTDLSVTTAPNLRDLVNPSGQLNAPLMHNGAFTSIAQVIDHYDAIPGDNPNLSSVLRRPGAASNLSILPHNRNSISRHFF
jgi:cytochrome c peroxidase